MVDYNRYSITVAILLVIILYQIGSIFTTYGDRPSPAPVPPTVSATSLFRFKPLDGHRPGSVSVVTLKGRQQAVPAAPAAPAAAPPVTTAGVPPSPAAPQSPHVPTAPQAQAPPSAPSTPSQFYAQPDSKSSDETILTVVTTLKPTDKGTQKYHIQMNTLRALQFTKGVEVIVYAQDGGTKEQVEELGLGIQVSDDFRLSKVGTPILSTMMMHAEQTRNTTFYGFVNADLLFSTGLMPSLRAVMAKLQSGDFHPKVLMIGRRVNVEMGHLDPSSYEIIEEPEDVEPVVKALGPRAMPHELKSNDYLIMSPGTFDWEAVPAFAVGRVAFDQWMMDWAVHHDVETVDLSRTVTAIHQTGFDGNLASSATEQSLWNHPLGNHHYDHGKPDNARWRTIKAAGGVGFERKYEWGKLRASPAEDVQWKVVNCKKHPTWRLCHGETE